ncbi:hypothetical protein CKM354_000651700 [Cercospora kikuchii]|uniref:F-box domain-containing protein n=1 Tax=Cercospora kikuchii TaxID=84275 RepID=A0A9P3CP86_9PEZI|nr:uncharacterized protein CKM354_000651700 [Cercospora kikuchii]GIZ43285.1 hypothetical protein CKM354_000651700 [Cercospora kikuchii]
MESRSAESHSEERRIFDFFNLPLELRHMIYDHLANHKKEVGSMSMLGTYSARAAVVGQQQPHLLRINKQFSQEYRPRFKRVTKTLVLTHVDRRRRIPLIYPMAKFKYFKGIRNITVNMVLSCIPGTARTYEKFLRDLKFCGDTGWLFINFVMLVIEAGVEDVEIRVFTVRRANVEDPRIRRPMQANLGRLTRPGLTALSSVRVATLGKDGYTMEASEGCGQYGKWTAQGGWNWT